MSSTNSQFLSQDSLFLKLPENENGSAAPGDLLEGIQSKTSYDELIDITYYLLKDTSLSVAEHLKLWEIRLTLHLFNNQLTFAKKEAINLNNALYLHENNNTAPASAQSTQSPRTNDSRSNSLNSTAGDSVGVSSGLSPIYSLPKNNDGMIDHSLLVMILRLKSIPNLNLVNELYKLCYQLRLRSSADQEKPQRLKVKLINLSYDVAVILSITKNYHTLLNYLQSVRYELLQRRKHRVCDDDYAQYLSNVTLVWLVSMATLHVKNGVSAEKVVDLLTAHHAAAYADINTRSKDALVYVLKNISPVPSSAETPAVSEPGLSIAGLVSLVAHGSLSGRIICSTIGMWDISNVYGFELTQDGLARHPVHDSPDSSPIAQSYHALSADWCNYIYKVYGLE